MMDVKLLLVIVVTFTACNAGALKGKEALRFCGVAYDIIKGNPDGSTQGSSTVTDPGIKTTREVVKCSYADASAISVPRKSCKEQENIYENTKSYHEKLMTEVNVNAEGSYYGFGFTASAGYKAAKEQTTKSHELIFEKSKTCYLGTVRYKMELAQAMKYKLSNSFAAAVCALPASFNSQSRKAYMYFFDRWGTHAITQIELGTKNIERKKTTSESVLSFAEQHYSASISASYSGLVGSGSLSVDVSGMKSTEQFKSLFQSSVTRYDIGSEAFPEPIELTLKELTEFLTPAFWQNLSELKSSGICSSSFNRQSVFTSLKMALNDYPRWLRVEKPLDDAVSVPLSWPRGSYGLLMPTMACMKRDATTVNKDSIKTQCPQDSWHTGYRFHDNDDYKCASKWLTSNNCMQGYVNHRGFQWHFCMQHTPTGLYRRDWPAGSYCIFRKGGKCPKGFTDGYLRYDDEDTNNSNLVSGYVPDGYYGPDHSTKYRFCCREDAFPTRKMFLPLERPFYLLAVTRHCQQVYGMKVHKEEFYSDDENSNNGNGRHGLFPYTYGYTENTRLIMCYYSKA